MDYKLALELKEAGFPQIRPGSILGKPNIFSLVYPPDLDLGDPIISDNIELRQRIGAHQPSLEELIEACGNNFSGLVRDLYPDGSTREWIAHDTDDPNIDGYGPTPLEAAARLYIALKKK